MGLPFEGRPVMWKREMIYDSLVRCRHFKHNKEIKRKQLEQAILRALKDGCHEEDVVAGHASFHNCLISASGSVPVHMFHYVDDVKKLKNFSWGKACYEMLMENIPFCAAWCRLMERGKGAESGDTSGEEDETSDFNEEVPKGEKKNKKQNRPKGCPPGCALALIVWFYEHLQFPKGLRYTGGIPRYLNWKLYITWTRERFRSALIEVPGLSIRRRLEFSEAEKLLKEKGFIALSYVEMLGNEKALTRMHNRVAYLLLIQMTPVYWNLGMKPCSLLMNGVNPERFEQLNYAPKPKFIAGLDDISSSLEQQIGADADLLEWQLGIHAELMKKCQF